MGWPRFLIATSVARLLPKDHPARQELLEKALEIADNAGALVQERRAPDATTGP